ncbi:MAG TPA: hypothetical protein VLG44_05700 [Chlamydiales bacterium]|nr:hypothetical protein [Chlamydiales bacterium]
MRQKKTLLISILFSLFTHAFAIYLLQSHSLWFYSERKGFAQTLSKSAPIVQKVDLTFKNPAPSLKSLSCLAKNEPDPEIEPSKEYLFSQSLSHLDEISISVEKKEFQFPEIDYSKKLLLEENPPSLAALTSLPQLHAELLKQLEVPLLPVPPPKETFHQTAAAQEKVENFILASPLLAIQEEKEEVADFSVPEGMVTILEKASAVPLAANEIKTSDDLLKMPSLRELGTSSIGEMFDTELTFLPHKEGYLFALTIIPKPESQFPKIKQNVYFLIDKSNAIQKNRLKITTNAVTKALNFLDEDDNFNIFAFDNKFERLEANNIPANKSNKLRAKGFLQGLQLGSFFSSADPYRPLNALLFDKVPDNELATVIMITNGDGLSNQSKQSFFLHQWTAQNQGKFSLYTLAMSEDKNLNLLDLISALNKGKLYSTPTFQGIKRRVLKMAKSLHYPIAKDVACFPISRNPGNKIEIFPSFQQLPTLYADQPFVLMGTTKEITDFILFIQAKQKNGWVNIKKTISFLNAKPAEPGLETQWAIMKSQFLYEQYLREKNPTLLKDAHRLLEEHGLPALF